MILEDLLIDEVLVILCLLFLNLLGGSFSLNHNIACLCSPFLNTLQT